MITVEDYYKTTHKTSANSKDFELVEQDFDVFPKEGIYIGEYESVTGNRIPALIPLDQTNGVCFLTTPENEKTVKNTIQMMALRLALSIPPGLCKFTLFDAKGQGGNLINLSYLNSKIIGERILTDTYDLKSELLKVKNNIPMVIQKILGARYADKTLVDYNGNAGELAKPYHIIVLTDVPYSIDKETGELLKQIVKTGRKAGIFTIISFDTSFTVGKEYEYNPMPLLDSMTVIYEKGQRFYVKNLLNDEMLRRFALHLDTAFPDATQTEEIQDYINKNLQRAQNVAVSLADKFTEKNMWTSDASYGIEVPIGKVNATDIQNFVLSVEDGRGQSYHHCLIGGSTGSGKTVLLHNIICNTAWLYSPQEVQFLLLDFKEGTEFNVYKDLPHVKVLSIKSELEFAKNVFKYLDDEITRRGELYKPLGATNLLEYNKNAIEKLPRYVIIIDEFQKLFDSSYLAAEYFAGRISDIGKRGRSFGINMILSTQGLGDLSIGHSLDEFGLRISMRLNSENECTKILGPNNYAPRSLTKKGESVYCPGGNYKDNVIYQVAYLNETRIKDMVSKLRSKYESNINEDFSRYIFDGETPVEISVNLAIQNLIPTDGKIKVYIGTPFSLSDSHIYYSLQRENGYNVLMIGQDQEAATSVIFHSLEQIVKQTSEEGRFIVCDKTNEESGLYGKYRELQKKYSNLRVETDDEEIEKRIEQICVELNKRKTQKGKYARLVLAFHNLYNFRPVRILRGDRTTSVCTKLTEIVSDGPEYGIHVIAYVDTWQHYERIFDSRDFIFEWRIGIELKGGEGYKVFGGADKSTVRNSYTANLRSAEMEEEIEKIKIYKL